MKSLTLLSGLLFLSILIKGQSPGIIIRPAGGGTSTLLNPNGDEWISTGTTGFISNDITESEIPYKGIPAVINEASGDAKFAPAGGYSDFVSTSSNDGFLAYSDGTNLFFRMRVGGVVRGTKAYSVLIDADNRFGVTGALRDANYVEATNGNNGNPGFEWEVVFETNNRVAVYALDGSNTPVLVNTYPVATHSQISIALTNTSGDLDFYYDFVVPLSAFSGAISNTTYLRFAATTLMAAGSALNNQKSDIYGAGSFSVAELAYATVINHSVPVTPANLNTASFVVPAVKTAAPVLTVPISAGTTTVQGIWTRLDASKPSLATITVFKNRVALTTTTATSGTAWSISGMSLSVGDILSVVAQAAGETVSDNSNAYTVLSCLSGTTPASGLSFTCATVKGMMGNRPSGASVRIYRTTAAGSALFATDISSPYSITYPSATTWRYDGANSGGINACTAGATDVAANQYFITATQTGMCESAPVIAGGCSLGTTTAAPVISQPVLYQEINIISGTAAAGSIVRCYKNGYLAGIRNVAGINYSFNTISLYNGDVVTVTAQAPGECISSAVSRTVVIFTNPPVINTNVTGTLTHGATAITGTSTEPSGTVIRVYESGVLAGTTTVQPNGTWSLTKTVMAGNTYYATAQSTGAAVSTRSATINVQIGSSVTPRITGTYQENAVAVTGTLPVNFTGKIYLYLDGQKIDSVNVRLANTWSIAVNSSFTNMLYPGGVLTATVRSTGNAESLTSSNQVIISCTMPAAPPATPVTSVTCVGGTAVFTINPSENGILYTIRDNADAVNLGVSKFGNGGAITLTTPVQIVAGIFSVRIKATSFSGPGCETLITGSITVNTGTTSGSVGSAATVCAGTNSTLLTVSGHSGNIVKWQSSTDNFTSAINDIANTTASLTVSNIGVTTQYRAEVQNTGCSSALTPPVEITVKASGGWIGGPSGDWNVASNWCGGVPVTTTNVIIPSGVSVYIQSANAVAKTITIDAGGSLIMTGSYNLAITATGSFTNNGTFSATASTGYVLLTGACTINGTTVFKNIEVKGATNISTGITISGTLRIRTGGTITGNAPSYTCPSSILLYRSGGNYPRGIEWSSNTSGPGCPSNVLIQSNTSVNFPVGGDGYICNDLIIDAGSSLKQDFAGGSAALHIGRNITVNGTLTLGNIAGGDIFVKGNWTRGATGVFTHNDRKVIFEGTGMSSISAPASTLKNNEGGFGGENFAHLWMNKTNATDSLVLLSNITVNRELGFTKGTFSLRNRDVTLVSNSSRTADVAPVTNTSDIVIRYGGTGRFFIQRFIQNPTGVRSWRLLAAPLQSASAPNINTAWQEGVANPDKNNPNGSGGIYNPWPGYGTHITGPGGAYSAANGFDQGTNSASILYANAGITSWASPASTTGTKITDQQGWMLFVRGDRSFVIGNQYVPSQNTTLEAKGKINIGNVTVPVVAGKQVIANPYPAAISLLNIDIAGTAGKEATYYMWDPKMFTSYTQPGKWVTFTGIGNSFIQTTSESPYTADGNIESGQAFVIEAPAAGLLTFHESDKKSLTSSLVGIANAAGARPMLPRPVAVFRTDIYAGNANGEFKLTDGVVNVFGDDFDNEVNAGDARKLISFNTKESLSILRDSVKLAIEKRTAVRSLDTVFYTLSKFNELPYQFRFTASDFATGTEAILIDRYSNNLITINTTGSTTVDFAINSDSLSKAADRFSVLFKRPGAVLPLLFTNIQAWPQQAATRIQWEVNRELEVNRYLVQRSADGVNFEDVHIVSSTGNTKYAVTDEAMPEATNFYRIAAITTGGKTIYSKTVTVTVKNKGSITVYPNPVTNTAMQLQFKEMAAGSYSLKLLSTSGTEVLNGKIGHIQNTPATYSIPFKKIVPAGIYHLHIKGDSENTATIIKVVVK